MRNITNVRIADTARKIGDPTLLPVPEDVHMYVEGAELDKLLNLNSTDPDLVDPISDPGWNPTPRQSCSVLIVTLNKVVAVQAT